MINNIHKFVKNISLQLGIDNTKYAKNGLHHA